MLRHLLLLCFVSCLFLSSCQPAGDVHPPLPTDEKKKEQKPPPPEPVKFMQLQPGIHQETTSLPEGGNLRYTILVPAGYETGKPVPLILALHYGGTVKPFYGRGMIEGLIQPGLGELGAIIVAPDSLGGDWQQPKNEEAVVWLARSIMKTYDIDPEKVLLTGFSMGGEGTWFVGARHADLFTAGLPIAGAPRNTQEWTLPIYVIHSSKDEVLPISLTEKRVPELKEAGVNIEFNKLNNLTHFQVAEYADELKKAVPWIKQAWK